MERAMTFCDCPFVEAAVKIEATGFKPMFSLDAGIGDLIKGYTMIKNTCYGNV